MKTLTAKSPKRQLPVSQKAYDSFITRMYTTLCELLNRQDLFEDAVKLIDQYLETRTFAAYEHSTQVVIAFSILRPEIDNACARSASARQRAAKRKACKAPDAVTTQTPTSHNQPMLNRSQRRAARQEQLRELRRMARKQKRSAHPNSEATDR